MNNRTMHDRRPGGVQSSPDHFLSMERLTAGQVEASTGGILVSGSRNLVTSGISIDSRTLRPGDLFFAIRGPHTDGHQNVSSALSRGACGAVVDFNYEHPEALPADRILLRVQNTHQALKDLATEARRQWHGSLIGITGSIGKTTTKEMVTHVLRTEYSVYCSPGNYNNLFGLPLSLFGLSNDDHIGIFEMGMSARGEIAELCRIARPDVGVIINIAPVHLEFFDSIEEIARAKGELAEALEPNGTLVYNAGDPLVTGIGSRFSGHKISFGLPQDADVRASEIEVQGLHETRFQVSCMGITQKASIPLAGLHYVMNILPAIALGRHYRIPLEQIIDSLKDIRQTPMRGQILRFKDGFTLIDDSYNSNPRALMQMTETLSNLLSCRRRILVAGEMLELGSDSPSLHYECGTWAARCGIDIVIGVQGNAQELARGAIAGGIPAAQVHFFATVNAAAEFINGTVQAGDLLLVKGSRGVRLERIVEAVRSKFEEETN